jgi:hypothetical protein
LAELDGKTPFFHDDIESNNSHVLGFLMAQFARQDGACTRDLFIAGLIRGRADRRS